MHAILCSLGLGSVPSSAPQRGGGAQLSSTCGLLLLARPAALLDGCVGAESQGVSYCREHSTCYEATRAGAGVSLPSLRLAGHYTLVANIAVRAGTRYQ